MVQQPSDLLSSLSDGVQQIAKVRAKDGSGAVGSRAALGQSRGLAFEDIVYPASGKPGGVTAKQDAIGADHVQRLAKNLRQRKPAGLRSHPSIRTGSVEINIRAQIGNHQRLTKIARAKMRNHERNGRKR